jgi:integral membrane protein
MFNTAHSRFRIISLLEGISYLILVFIAMPIKYIGDNPLPVKYVGMGHGVLFIIFCIFLFEVTTRDKWNIKFSIKMFILSLIPFGFIFIDKDIKKPVFKV